MAQARRSSAAAAGACCTVDKNDFASETQQPDVATMLRPSLSRPGKSAQNSRVIRSRANAWPDGERGYARARCSS